MLLCKRCMFVLQQISVIYMFIRTYTTYMYLYLLIVSLISMNQCKDDRFISCLNFVYFCVVHEVNQPHLPLQYREQLVSACNKAATASNKRLTKHFGVEKTSGIFFVHLSLAPKGLVSEENQEEYITRNAAKLESWEALSVETVYKPIVKVDGPFVSPRNVIVLGMAGIGKTTATHKIAYSFNSQDDCQFQAVYRFECRNFRSNSNDKYSFADLIFHIHGPDRKPEQREQILDALDNPSTLIIFDGLDELDALTNFIPEDYPPICSLNMPTIFPKSISLPTRWPHASKCKVPVHYKTQQKC